MFFSKNRQDVEDLKKKQAQESEKDNQTQTALKIAQMEEAKLKNEIKEDKPDLSSILKIARSRFPDAVSDEVAIKALVKALEDEDAGLLGLDKEEFIRRRDSIEDFRRWKKEEERKKDLQKNTNKIMLSWREDEKKLQKLVPEFSLKKALKDERFRKLIEEGNDIFTSYAKVTKDFGVNEKNKTIDEVGSSAYSSLSGSQGVDVASASPEVFKSYINRILEN